MTRIAIVFAAAALLRAADWSAPVEVYHDDKKALTYRAAWTGDFLVVRAEIEPGWHTFAMDNKQRQQEKLAGKPSLGLEKPTEVQVEGGLSLAGPWFQNAPKDFSKPELRWFSWGFEKQATFAAKAKRAGAAPAKLTITGQACTDSICKNIDVTVDVPAAPAKTVDPGFATLTQVRK